MKYRSWRAGIATAILAFALAACTDPLSEQPEVSIEVALASLDIAPESRLTAVQVGERIYKDRTISRVKNQSCESCHMDSWGFGPPGNGSIGSIAFAFFEGSVPGRFGDRRPPTAAYTFTAPALHWDPAPENVWRGGLFWDGRAAGQNTLISPLVEQALGPFLSDVEHAFSKTCVLYAIFRSSYRSDFERISGTRLDRLPFDRISGGPDAFCHGGAPTYPVVPDYPSNFNVTHRTMVDEAYLWSGRLIAEFEASPAVNPFNSRFDSGNLTPFELQGRALFEGKALCASCHMSEAEDGPEIFTDFSYYNIGVPRHPLNPKGADWRDPGIGPVARALFPGVGNQQADGHFKSPSLRNVARTVSGGPKTFMHNGVLRSLEEVVHFYNTRDSERCAPGAAWVPHDASAHIALSLDSKKGGGGGNEPTPDPRHCWPEPDFPNNNLIGAPGGILPEIGNLGLTPTEEAAIVAYMKALNDASAGTPANSPPMASFTFACDGLACSFDGTGSRDPDGHIVSHSWDFGDGSPAASGPTVTRTFASGGTRTVTLVVTDNGGATASASRTVTTLSLAATMAKVKGAWAGNLSWSGADGRGVDVFRSGTRVASNVTGSTYQDATGNKGSGTVSYRICLSGTSTCSNTVTLSF
jgi:cytochrome c peroxidase